MKWFYFFAIALALFVGAHFVYAMPDQLPTGYLDFASPNSIYGWAYDADAGNAPITVHIYIDGVPTLAITADKRRDDLVTAGVTPDSFHGFEWAPPKLSQGTHSIRAFAINAPSGVNPELKGSPRSFFVAQDQSNRLPQGVLDIVASDRLSGWAYDPDAGTNPVWVHFYIDGKLAGATVAEKRRDDLVAAGVTPDPFHGFTWIPTTLSAGTHTVSAWAINTPPGLNPQLRSSPRTLQVPPGTFVGMAFIENGTVKVGANLNWGGALSYIGHQDVNLVDDNDTGRLIQASFYDKNESYPAHFDSNWGWNPVQGGDKYGRGSRVLEFSQTPTTLYTKTQPLQWNPDNKGGGAAQTVLSPLILESWVTLSSQFPELIQVRQRVTSQDTKARTGNHEVPAMFIQWPFRQLVLYRGTNPWTNGPVSNPAFSEFPFIETFLDATERWAAWVNPQNFGLTLYVPNHPQGDQFNAYWINRVTNYLKPGLSATLTPGTPWEITYYLIVGNYPDSQNIIYQLQNVR